MKFILVLVLGVMSCTGYVAYQKLGPPSEPYRAYQQYATSSLRGGQMAARHALARFGASGQVPDTGGISYELESQTWNGSDSVEIVAIQYVTRVYRDSFGNPSGRPKVSKSRQHARVERVDGRWQVTELEEEDLP